MNTISKEKIKISDNNPHNTIVKSLIKKINSILFLNDAEKSVEIRKYISQISGETINYRLDISLLFNKEGEFIVKNDIEMINGIND